MAVNLAGWSLVAAIACGGAAGALGRYGVQKLALAWFGPVFPIGTLTVNVVGSFVMGLVAATIAQRMDVAEEFRMFLSVGFLGAFTTFSTFSLDVFGLFERGQWLAMSGYIVLSVLLSIAALVAGVALGRGL